MTVKFGVFVPQGWTMDLVEIQDPVEKYEAMTNVARQADAGGWDSIWVFDHFHTVPEPVLETTFECWSITAGPGARYPAGQSGADGGLQRLPQPGPLRQDRLDG